MNKIFIYVCPCVNKAKILFMMRCSAVIFASFPENPKIDSNDEKISGLFLGLSFALVTQTNS